MNKSQLVNNLSLRLGVDRQSTIIMLDTVLDEIIRSCADGEDVRIVNFGQFEVRDYGPAKRRDPRTGQQVEAPATSRVRFRPAASFKERVATHTRQVSSPNATISY